MSSWEAILFLLKGLGGNKCGIYTPADRSTQMIEKWNVVPSLTFMSASQVGHNICKISTGMIHLISNQVLYEPVFCALSWGVFISTWSVPYPTLSISTIQFHPNPTQSILKCSNFPKLLIIWPLFCENYPPLKLIKKTEVLLDGGVR